MLYQVDCERSIFACELEGRPPNSQRPLRPLVAITAAVIGALATRATDKSNAELRQKYRRRI